SPERLSDLGTLADELVAEFDRAGKARAGRSKIDLEDVIRNGRADLFQKTGKPDRSAAEWYAINELIRRGRGADEIVAIFLDVNNHIGDHARDHPEGAEKHVRRQVEKALGAAPDPFVYGGLIDSIALQFSAKYVNALRYVAAWGKWLRWDGVRWAFEDTLLAYDLARTLCRAAGDAEPATVAGVINLARTDRRQAAITGQWDADPWLLGTPKGTIDLRTGKLFAPRPLDYITKITSIAPDSRMPLPLWFAFLDRVTDGNKELQAYLQRVSGYCLTGITIEDALFFLYGLGKNGKSVFLRAISGILGEYHEVAAMDMFVVTMGERHPTDLAQLRGARLVTAIETEQGRRWNESKLKMLTGGDPISARFMRQDFFKYIPQFKLAIAGNHKLVIRNVDQAIRRRMNLLPFVVEIPEAERDKKLGEKLKAEWPGSLYGRIQGCVKWQQQELNPPAIVTDATEGYLESQDDVQIFLDECCVAARSEYDTVEHIWDGWVDWAEDCGEFVGTKRRL